MISHMSARQLAVLGELARLADTGDYGSRGIVPPAAIKLDRVMTTMRALDARGLVIRAKVNDQLGFIVTDEGREALGMRAERDTALKLSPAALAVVPEIVKWLQVKAEDHTGSGALALHTAAAVLEQAAELHVDD